MACILLSVLQRELKIRLVALSWKKLAFLKKKLIIFGIFYLIRQECF